MDNDLEECDVESQCYVCLEACTERSPCKCATPLHESCLKTMQATMPHRECTICKTPLDIEWTGFSNTDPSDVEIDDPGPAPPVCYMFAIRIAYGFFVYIVLGWMGKIVFMVFTDEEQNNYAFWTLEHFVAATCMFAVASCVYFRMKFGEARD